MAGFWLLFAVGSIYQAKLTKLSLEVEAAGAFKCPGLGVNCFIVIFSFSVPTVCSSGGSSGVPDPFFSWVE